MIAASEHILRIPYAGFYQVAVHGHAGFLPEQSAKIYGVQAGHLLHRDFFSVVLGNMADGPLDADVIQGDGGMTDYQFKETVDDDDEAGMLLFRTGEDKLDGETGHEAVGPGIGGPDMTRREAKEIACGKVIGNTIDTVTYGAIGEAPEREDAFLDTPHGGGLTEDAIIDLGNNAFVYFTKMGLKVYREGKWIKTRKKRIRGERSFIRLELVRIGSGKRGGGGGGGVIN
jgi:hypothetical protein